MTAHYCALCGLHRPADDDHLEAMHEDSAGIPTFCERCGRLWMPSLTESPFFVGSACDKGECLCLHCEESDMRCGNCGALANRKVKLVGHEWPACNRCESALAMAFIGTEEERARLRFVMEEIWPLAMVQLPEDSAPVVGSAGAVKNVSSGPLEISGGARTVKLEAGESVTFEARPRRPPRRVADDGIATTEDELRALLEDAEPFRTDAERAVLRSPKLAEQARFARRDWLCILEALEVAGDVTELADKPVVVSDGKRIADHIHTRLGIDLTELWAFMGGRGTR